MDCVVREVEMIEEEAEEDMIEMKIKEVVTEEEEVIVTETIVMVSHIIEIEEAMIVMMAHVVAIEAEVATVMLINVLVS